MQSYTDFTKLCTANGTAVALGYFDGVHLGHRAVIDGAVQYARSHGLKSAVFTFTLPIGARLKGKNILDDTQKRERIAQLGADYYIAPQFCEFQELTPQEFADEILIGVFGAAAVFCGDNFTFGAHKTGNTTMLRELCAAREIKLFQEHLAQYKGEAVSSSRIRECLSNGAIDSVNAMLGTPYSEAYPVVHGKGLGSTLGVPTINQIYPPHMLMPKSGVYATKAYIKGKVYPAATGIGSRPTVSGEGVTCESFIKGFSGDVYGENIKIEFIQYLHDTKRYDNVEALRDMINKAAEKSEALFGLEVPL